MSRRFSIARDERRSARLPHRRPDGAATTLRDARRESAARGQPLARGIGRRLERGLGHSFAEVRVHDDAAADAAARELGARAVTVGDDIFFRAGSYDPATPAGLHLLAHEAAHTVQQRGATEQRATAVDERYDALETQADRAASAVVESGTGTEAAARAPSVSATPGAPGVQLKPDEPGLFNNPSIRNPWLQGGWNVATDDLLGGILDFGSAASSGGVG